MWCMNEYHHITQESLIDENIYFHLFISSFLFVHPFMLPKSGSSTKNGEYAAMSWSLNTHTHTGTHMVLALVTSSFFRGTCLKGIQRTYWIFRDFALRASLAFHEQQWYSSAQCFCLLCDIFTFSTFLKASLSAYIAFRGDAFDQRITRGLKESGIMLIREAENILTNNKFKTM